MTYKRATLVVPPGAVETYRNTYPWSKFYIGEQMEAQTYSDFKIRDYPHGDSKRGLTADGLTRLMLSTGNSYPDAGKVSITARVGGQVTTDPNLTGAIGSLFRDDIKGYSFILTAPDGYHGPDNSSYTLELELKAGQDKSYHAFLEVMRPGVLLLHGLNSSADCWSLASGQLIGSGAYSPAQVVNVSYQAANKVSFDDNTHRYNVVGRNMDNLYAQLSSAGIASSRYDLVGHSMGGILSRKYAQEVNSRAVNRILTFDTPHSGSSLALLPDKLNISALDVALGKVGAKWVFNALLNDYMAGHDLNPSSDAIARLNSPQNLARAAGIPCHAACTVFDGADDNIEPDFFVRPLTVAVGQSMEPQVTVHWPDGSQTQVRATLTLLGAEGIATTADGAISGVSEGECRLAATYRSMTDTIPVKVINGYEGVGTVTAGTPGDVRLFTRADMLVAEFTGSYEGTADLELYTPDGLLVGRSSFGGQYEPGDELAMHLPGPTGRIYIARCRLRDATAVMKLLR